MLYLTSYSFLNEETEHDARNQRISDRWNEVMLSDSEIEDDPYWFLEKNFNTKGKQG